MRKKTLLFLLYAAVAWALCVLAGCGRAGVPALFAPLSTHTGGTIFATIGNHHLSLARVQAEYQAWVKANFPQALWRRKLGDRQALHAYGERMALQYLLLVAARADGSLRAHAHDLALLRQAAEREACAEYYLGTRVDLERVLENPVFRSLNEKAVHSLYEKNKQAYQAKQVDKDTARRSLRVAMLRKRRALVQEYLYSKRLALLQSLVRKHRFDIRQPQPGHTLARQQTAVTNKKGKTK